MYLSNNISLRRRSISMAFPTVVFPSSLFLLFLSRFISTAHATRGSYSTVNQYLPGFPGLLPFQLETGLEDEEANKEGIPQLILNPYSWTKHIVIVLPEGTGFSYDTITPSSFKPGDFSQI
ncbi:hypothetical protein Csa_011999 [Cucumis sativus]|uniref:Uncharacterized protein n=1 Tax=Cucumis sativus TaxID=3659 RepID=A0A0A0KZZ0_CUCSA|nr:hypothetical protein Csa_011999 [Cucumis sativus]